MRRGRYGQGGVAAFSGEGVELGGVPWEGGSGGRGAVQHVWLWLLRVGRSGGGGRGNDGDMGKGGCAL